jgi:phosphoglycolate phosphatase
LGGNYFELYNSQDDGATCLLPLVLWNLGLKRTDHDKEAGNMKKVIFDLDGTLYQTHITVGKAVNETFKEYSFPSVDVDVLKRNIGKTKENFLKGILPEQIWKNYFDGREEEFNRFNERLRYHERKAVPECGRLFEGVKELLISLVDLGYELIICSNGSNEYIDIVLDSMGIRKYFSGVYSSKYSPSKGFLLKQMYQEGNYAIVVGDTRIDYEAAKEASLPSIAVTFGYGREDDYEAATFTAATAEEVLDKIILTDVFQLIARKLIYRRKCRIICINGVDTSGKTLFTRQFSRYLKSVDVANEILSIDDYHNPSEVRYQGANEIEAYYNNAFQYQKEIHAEP